MVITVEEFLEYDNQEEYEIFNENTQTWESAKASPYLAGSFGKPETAEKMITSIAMQMGGRMIAMGMKDYTPSDPNVKYYKFTNEKSMLNSFVEIIQKYGPDIISGWYSIGYDIPYIINRCYLILGEERTKDISPWRIIKQRMVPTKFGKEFMTYDIYGIAHLDYRDIYIKFSSNKPESYTLDQIAYEELKKKKLDYSEYGSLAKLYKENFQKFMDYNIRDTALLPMLEKKLKFIELAALIAYYSRTNFSDVFFNTRIWDALIFNHLKKKNVVIDAKTETDTKRIDGGHVKEPIQGLYGWNVTYDGTSLYPKAIITGNISPDTFVRKEEVSVDQIVQHGNPLYEMIKLEDLSMAGNGSLFRRDKKGFLVEMMEELFNMRKDYKDKMLEADRAIQHAPDEKEKQRLTDLRDYYNSYQNVLKILLNSAFGAMAAPGFRYCHSHYGEAITLTGQLTLKWGEKYVNKKINEIMKTEGVDYLIYCDTDSLFVHLQPLIDKLGLKDNDKIIEFLDRFSQEKMAPLFHDMYTDLAKWMNFRSPEIHFKREKISDSAIFLGKKRYILNVWDKEGTRYSEPKIAVTGAESVRSSTPEVARNALKDSFTLILNKTNDDVLKYKDDFRAKFKKCEVEDIALPKSANGLSEYSNKTTIYGFKCPLHVRGSLLYNHYLKEFGLDDVYQPITDGQKIRYVYLKLPNPIKENVIAFPSVLPKEFGLHEHVDYDKMFRKAYSDPLDGVFEAIQWKKEDILTLEDFF